MKRLAILVFLMMFHLQCFGQEMELVKSRHKGIDREYWLYAPDSLSQERPLLILLHGYGGSAKGYHPELAEYARKYGFVYCVPQGCKDPAGEPGWNVGYPSQEDMKTDDVEFVGYLIKTLCRKYSLNRSNVFLAGMSNGGEMCYLMASEHPGWFRAIASVSGLTMGWIVKDRPIPDKPVAFLEFHGTEDKVSLWEGDPQNHEGWGAYTSVSVAMSRIVSANRCTYETVEELPKKSEKSNKVILHRYLGGSKEARLYEVVGGVHSWHFDDLDTVAEIWNFFSDQMKGASKQ